MAETATRREEGPVERAQRFDALGALSTAGMARLLPDSTS
jgi:hypothetical protein